MSNNSALRWHITHPILRRCSHFDSIYNLNIIFISLILRHAHSKKCTAPVWDIFSSEFEPTPSAIHLLLQAHSIYWFAELYRAFAPFFLNSSIPDSPVFCAVYWFGKMKQRIVIILGNITYGILWISGKTIDPIPAAGTAVPCTSVLHVPGSEGRVPLQRLMDFRLEAQCSGNGFEDMTYTSQMHLHSCLVVLPNEHSKPPELRGFCTGVLLYCADMWSSDTVAIYGVVTWGVSVGWRYIIGRYNYIICIRYVIHRHFPLYALD